MKNLRNQLIFSPKENVLLYETVDGFQVWLSGTKNIETFTRFAYDIFEEVYIREFNWSPTKAVYKGMLEIDKSHLDSSYYFIFTTPTQEIIGAGKMTKKVMGTTIRIEDEYEINLQGIYQKHQLNPTETWHISRLSVDKSKIKALGMSRGTSAKIFTEFTKLACIVLSRFDDNVCFAELGENTLSLYTRFLGIKWEIIGEPLHSLGSPDYPVFTTGEIAKNWLTKQKEQHRKAA